MAEQRYTVTITRKTRWVHESTENLVTHEEPTDKQEQAYGGGTKVVMKRDFAPVQKKETRECDEKVYEQTVENLDIDEVVLSVLHAATPKGKDVTP